MSKTIVSTVGTETYEPIPTNGNGQDYANVTTTDVPASALNLFGKVGKAGSAKEKRIVRITMPMEDATTGEVRYNTVRIEVSGDPRDLPDDLAELRERAAYVLSNSQYDLFWEIGQERS